MKKWILNFLVDLFSVWIEVLAGIYAIQSHNFLLAVLLWTLAFITQDAHVYFRNKLNK